MSKTITAEERQYQQPVTRLLSAWQSGDSEALHRLTPIIYDELRRRARQYMQRERQDHTLCATAVVNETFMQLLDMHVSLNDRKHFFAIAATQMRRILVDHAKSRSSEKRGRKLVQSLDDCVGADQIADASQLGIVEMDDALSKLAKHNAQLAELVEMHYFAGLTYKEIAKAENLPEITVERQLRMAKAWLLRNMQLPGSEGDEASEH